MEYQLSAYKSLKVWMSLEMSAKESTQMFERILSRKSNKTKNFVWRNIRMTLGPIHIFSCSWPFLIDQFVYTSWIHVRIFQKSMNLNRNWCPFEHVNVGHEMTKETSPVYVCLPAAPPELEIEVDCPTNSTVFKCQKNGTWTPFEGNCGCYIQQKWYISPSISTKTTNSMLPSNGRMFSSGERPQLYMMYDTSLLYSTY